MNFPTEPLTITLPDPKDNLGRYVSFGSPAMRLKAKTMKVFVDHLPAYVHLWGDPEWYNVETATWEPVK